MNLDTVNKKLLNTGKLGFWKFLLFFGLTPATWFLVFYSFFNPELAQAVITEQTIILKSLTLLAFTCVSLLITMTVILGGLGIIKLLKIANNQLVENSGVFIGKSLSTNHEFLRNLAKGLYQYLILFIRAYNDPRFQELEEKHTRETNELKSRMTKLETTVKSQDEKILNQDSTIDSQNKTIARQGLGLFFANWEIKKLKRENDALKKNQEETKTIVSDKFQANNESSKS